MSWESTSLNNRGRIIAHSRQQHRQQHAMYTLRRTSGPTNWFNILKGLSDQLILPVGGGKYGEWFGSFLPFPVGFTAALLFSTMSSLTKIEPCFFSSP